MTFKVKQIEEQRKFAGSYRYLITYQGSDFAIFTHNFRGECETITILKGKKTHQAPCGMVHHFLTGGGPEPLGLTHNAQTYLQTFLLK